MEHAIAERMLIVELRNGEQRPVTIRIGTPYSDGEESWACPWEVEGLYSGLADARGIDSFQALILAQHLIKTLLFAVLRDGGRLLTAVDDREETPSEIDLEAMFTRGM